MGVEGSDVTRLTHDQGVDANPAWSPDGLRIAFDRSRNGARQIYLMNADGSDDYALTPGPADVGPGHRCRLL